MAASQMPVGDISAAFGCSDQNVYRWLKMGMPRGPIEACREWVADNIAPNGPPTVGERAAGHPRRRDHAAHELDEAEQRAKIAKLEEEARAKQLANDEREGRLLERDDVVLQVAEVVSMVRATLERMPNELESEIPASHRAQTVERLRDYVRLMLTRMSQHQFEWEKPTE